jgi:hypothetical protein
MCGEQSTSGASPPKMHFENQYEVTKQMMLHRNRLSVRANPVRFWVTLFETTVLMGVIGLLVFSAILLGSKTTVTTYLAIAALVFCLGTDLLSNRIIAHRTFKHTAKEYGLEKLELRFRFYDECFEVKDFESVTTVSYDRIRYIDEVEDHYRLWIEDNIGYILYKNAFTTGYSEHFKIFILKNGFKTRPIFTKARQNLQLLKKHIPSIVLPVFLILVFVSAIPKNTGTLEHIIEGLSDDEQHIATVELPGGAVIFTAREAGDRIGAGLFRESRKRYIYVDGHEYHLSDVVEYNKSGTRLFEDSGLFLGGGGWAVYYGVGDHSWWHYIVSAETRERYTTSVFQLGADYFVLYYRVQMEGV